MRPKCFLVIAEPAERVNLYLATAFSRLNRCSHLTRYILPCGLSTLCSVVRFTKVQGPELKSDNKRNFVKVVQ